MRPALVGVGHDVTASRCKTKWGRESAHDLALRPSWSGPRLEMKVRAAREIDTFPYWPAR